MPHSSLINRVWSFAQADPEKVILQDFEKSWTWRELLWRAHSYSVLIENKRTNGIAIPIGVSRTGDTVAAILGAIMSGRGFSPVSVHQPSSRLTNCLTALMAESLIIPEGVDYVSNSALEQLTLIQPKWDGVEAGLPEKPKPMAMSDILYVLFTSGSTGIPKGVLADCSNIENTMLWSMDMLDWHVEDVIGCCTNFFFDISMFDIFTTFYFGVPLAIYSNPSDVSQVAVETAKFKITSIFGVPNFFSQIVRHELTQHRDFSQLRRIIAGGDFFPPAHLIAWRNSRPEIDIFNVWGPTETSIVNTMHRITDVDKSLLEEGRSPSVGRSHSRMPLRLIDEDGQVIKMPNVRGEICMLGACVTKGYLGDAEKTALAYVNIQNQRAFRTQDIGYLDEQGNLFIVGRMGATVKVSGYRIDLGEVEVAATAVPGIHWACACVTTAHPDSGDRELWMAVEPINKEVDIDIYTIKKALRSSLPLYMVPKRILICLTLPRNANGKVDRAAVLSYMSEEISR